VLIWRLRGGSAAVSWGGAKRTTSRQERLGGT